MKMRENLRAKNTLLFGMHRKANVPNCNERITKYTGWNVRYIQRKTEGGKDNITNLMSLHPNCHRQIHNREKKVTADSGQTGLMEA
jgi:RNA-directed DNA polymerase